MTAAGPNRRETIAIATVAAGAALLPAERTPAARPTSAPHGRIGRDMPLDADWRFLRGAATGLEAPRLDDSGWRRIDLPHDWGVEDAPGGPSPDRIGPFDRKAGGGTATGFTVGGEGWYRKHFRVDGYPADSRIEILFGGVSVDCEVFLNGQRLGGNKHGYIPFALDLTPHLIRDGDNVLAVHVRNLGRNSRWYAGSGLYRGVSLDVLPPAARLTRWGVAAWTRALEGGHAAIDVTTSVEGVDAGLNLVTSLRDPAGKVVAEASSTATARVTQALSVRGPRLWAPDTPTLYTLETELRRGGAVVDRIVQPFGIRIVTFDPQRGMAINGAVTKLRGGCLHHDNGLLGACAYADADDRRVRLMKARGYNAIRSSHNPASATLRAACDRLGMLLIEEAFDAWFEAKEPQDFAASFRQHWQDVIPAMVLPARNSPSVIMWSIGNEIPSRATDEGVQWEWKLADAVKRLDPTRPVTAGLNGVLGQEMIADDATARPGRGGVVDNASTIFLDVPGYNYRIDDIEREQAAHPERVVYGSETFAREVFDYAALMRRAPYFLGEFVWTAMDYIGEAGLGATAQLKIGNPPFYFAGWPWVNAWCGDIDLTGAQKAASLARDVAWGVSPLEMTVQRPVADGRYEWISNWGWSDELASWSWMGSEGKPLSVRLYTSAGRVELLLDGRKIGEKTLSAADKMRAEFAVPYAAGMLEAVAYRGGKVIARRRLETVGPATALRIVPERVSGRTGREALVYVPIEVVDPQGRLLPDEKRKVRVAVSGPAELVAFGSADPLATGTLQGPEARTFRGRALAVLRGTGPGRVWIEASGDGVAGASKTVLLA